MSILIRKPEAATVDKIIAIAEKMFAEHGYRGVSLRALMRECGVNAAAVHYHFGSKEALLEEIFVRRAGALNSARLRLLDSSMQDAGVDNSGTLELILRAFLSPAFSLPDGDEGVRRFTRLRSVIAHENAELSQQLISRYFDETSGHFIAALRRALPRLPDQALFWRFHFLLGAQYYTLSNPGRIESLSGGSCDASDLQCALDEMIAFVAAGFRAPLPTSRGRGAQPKNLRRADSAAGAAGATGATGAAGAVGAAGAAAAGATAAGAGRARGAGNAGAATGTAGAIAHTRVAPAPSRQGTAADRRRAHDADLQISDVTWSAIAPLLEAASTRLDPPRGRKPISDREALSGIVYMMRHSLRWRDLSNASGFRSGASCWRRLREWEANGVWQQIEQVLREQLSDGLTLDYATVATRTNAAT
ncbi:transposase [Burkholderia sp. L27(2015)]|uniref:transposase n=1 Tax=Burkholderia sp. L27(2015) TaxID=1641858 RepID=UPI00131B0EDA|nr:transposase [Burkholderia sp. L27(2015)]